MSKRIITGIMIITMSALQRFFKPGQYLFHEGDPSRSMYLIKKGTVAIRKRKGSSSIEVARIYSNEVIGELSFFDRLPRSAGAVALTEVEALEIQFESLDKVYANVPDYMKTIIASLADRLRKANEMIRRLQKNTIPEGTEQPATEQSTNSPGSDEPTQGDPELKAIDDILAKEVAESTHSQSDPSDSGDGED